MVDAATCVPVWAWSTHRYYAGCPGPHVAELLSFISPACGRAERLSSLVEQPAMAVRPRPHSRRETEPPDRAGIVLSSAGSACRNRRAYSVAASQRRRRTVPVRMPWTLSVILPVSHQLLDETRTAETPGTDALLRKWGRLHNVRTGISLLALVILAANILGFVQ